jgi:hypothetical protein
VPLLQDGKLTVGDIQRLGYELQFKVLQDACHATHIDPKIQDEALTGEDVYNAYSIHDDSAD